MNFQLFRIKVLPSNQGNLFGDDLSRPEILRQVFQSNPEIEFRNGLVWHLGNISALDESSAYFRIGRSSRSTIERYEEGNFIDAPVETAPYTHAILDFQSEIMVVEYHKSNCRLQTELSKK